MANEKLKLITILQKQSSGKIPYDTKYQIEDSGKIIILKKEEGYSKGKFYYETGEDFDIQQHYNSQFIEIKKELNKEKESYYNEEVWEQFDKSINKESQQEKQLSYFDVTRIIEALPRYKEPSGEMGELKKYNYSLNIGFNFVSDAKLYFILENCGFKQIPNDNEMGIIVYELYDLEGVMGYLYSGFGIWYFAPETKKIGTEYNYEENQSLGFYYSAENYLYIALETLERYSLHLKPLLTDNNKNKNEISYGYQADSAIKTLLAFSCECYLKSLLVLEGKKLKDLKEIGHGLIELFISLEPETITQILEIYKYEKAFNFSRIEKAENSDSIDEFMSDLSKYSLAFTDARYSAENSKDTNYEFLKELAFSLREVLDKKYILSFKISPFYHEINEQLNKYLLG